MEIRHSPTPPYTPSPPAQQPTRTPAAQEVASTTGLAQERRDNGRTEYIARGELVEENDSTDYRDLIRAARQQRADSLQTEPGDTGSTTSPYAARAVSAYQSISETPAAAGQRQNLDALV